MNLRQIVLDTETTGLNPRSGDRIIEIGCLELINRRLTGSSLHLYVNPERDSEPGALAVHGLTTEFLSDKPKFAEVAHDICEFVGGGEILIHNAPFDVAFLDAEFERLNRPQFATHCAQIVDTLQLAKELHPGKRNSLDALCERYGISNAHRTLHGALLDASLLAEVYLAMTRGQENLVIEIEVPRGGAGLDSSPIALGQLIVLKASPEEEAEHLAFLEILRSDSKTEPVWIR
ncbi:MAG: DNA polymerase III subunit epsilon [Burkholderiaceae bacterium]|jgi:DNA polymerase-3 subunit epsilon